MVLIGTSTGGPAALTVVLGTLPAELGAVAYRTFCGLRGLTRLLRGRIRGHEQRDRNERCSASDVFHAFRS